MKRSEKGDRLENDLNHFLSFLSSGHSVYTYLHNTEKREVADKIIHEGFNFENHLDYTTDRINRNDPLEARNFIIKRKRYGLFTVAIEISTKIVDYYTLNLKNTNVHFSEILTSNKPVIGDNDEPIYRLTNQFVKGYFDHSTHRAIMNNSFNPFFHSPEFERNLYRILYE